MPRKAKEGDTQERILKAALRLFSSRGYEGVTVADVAAEAGVSRATVYRYFRGKRGLLLALLRTWHDFMEWIRRSGEPTGRSPWELVRVGGERVIQGLLAAPVLLREELLFLHLSAHDPQVREALADAYEAARQAVRDLVRLSPERVEADALAVFAVALLEGLLIQHLVDPERVDLIKLWPELLSLCEPQT